MRFLVWNCRGAGQASTIECLNAQILSVQPSVVCVMETMLNVNRSVGVIKNVVGDFESFVVPSVGLSGGMWLLWPKEMELELVYSEEWFIKMRMKYEGKLLYALAVYGNAKYEIRRMQWDYLEELVFYHGANYGWIDILAL
ncbi:hypothetical protein ACHQM5_012401 [Ranunculus cassubicifolius]